MTRTFAPVILLSLAACGPGNDDPDGTGIDPIPSGTDALPVDFVDSACLDGQWAEPALDPDAPIDDLLGSYTPGTAPAFVLDVLERRYPTGAWIVEQAQRVPDFGDCVETFMPPNQRQTVDDAIRRLSTVVHECGHFLDLGTSGFGAESFVFTPTLTFDCEGGDTTERFGNTFARSRLNGDAHAADLPPCASFSFEPGCDTYGFIYLDGNPDDGSFEGGDQGYSSVLEESVQYVNSLATDYALADQIPGSVSARDGILTFLWYTMRYLKLARTEYPAAHEFLVDDTCYREATLSMWGRAWWFLSRTADDPRLSLNDELLDLVDDPELLVEIETLRDAQGCP